MHECNHEEISDQIQVRDIALSDQLVIFQSVHVMKAKHYTPRFCWRWRETEESSPCSNEVGILLQRCIFLAFWWNMYIFLDPTSTLILSFLFWLLCWGFIEGTFFILKYFNLPCLCLCPFFSLAYLLDHFPTF